MVVTSTIDNVAAAKIGTTLSRQGAAMRTTAARRVVLSDDILILCTFFADLAGRNSGRMQFTKPTVSTLVCRGQFMRDGTHLSREQVWQTGRNLRATCDLT